MPDIPLTDAFLAQYAQRRELDTLPPATEFLNFATDQTHTIGEFRGPNLHGEWLTVVSCDVDPDTGRSRVGLAYGCITIRKDQQ